MKHAAVRWFVYGAIALGLVVLARLAGCGAADSSREYVRRIDARRAAALRDLLAGDQRAPLLPVESSMLAIHESLIADLVSAALPYEQRVPLYRIRLERVRADFDDGLALLNLYGVAAPAIGRFDPTLQIDLAAAIEKVDFDPALGQFRATARVIAVTTRRIGRGVPGIRGLLSDLFGLGAGSFKGVSYTLEIPVHVAPEIKLPSFDSDEGVRIEAARVPLAVTIGRNGPVALYDRFWIPVKIEVADHATVDTLASEPARLARAGKDSNPMLLPALRDSVLKRSARDPLLSQARRDSGDVLVASSAPLLGMLVREATGRYLDRVDINLHPEIEQQETGKVRVKTPLGKLSAGDWIVNIDVDRLSGRLHAGVPKLDMSAGGQIGLSVPARIESGSGRIGFDFKWKPGLFTSLLCRGFHDSVAVTGSILPQEHTLHGTLELRSERSQIVVRPHVVRDKLPFAVTLADSSWQAVFNSLKKQDRFLKCGMFMKPDSLVARLKRFGLAGVKIRLPTAFIPDLSLPANIARSVMILGRPVSLVAGSDRVVIKNGLVWSTANVRVFAGEGPGLPEEKPPPEESPGVPVRSQK